MNRSILIVICDFLVLAALSLSSGSVESSAHLQGQSKKDTAKRDTYIGELENAVMTGNADIAELKAKIVLLQEKYQNVSQSLEKKTGELQEQTNKNEQSQKIIAAHKEDLKIQEDRIQILVVESNKERIRQNDAEGKIVQISTDLKNTQDKLNQIMVVIADNKHIIESKDKQIQENNKQLAILQGEQAQQKVLMDEMKTTQIRNTLELEELRKKLHASERETSNLQGQLAIVDRERQSLSMKLTMSEHNQHQTATQLSEVRGKLSEAHKTIRAVEQTLDETRHDLDVSREEQEKVKVELGRSEEKVKNSVQVLDQTKKQLDIAEKKLNNNAVSSYFQAVSDLHVQIEIPRFPASLIKDSHYYYPYVKIGNANYLVSEMSSLFGMDAKNDSWNKVKKLSFSFSDNLRESKEFALKNPFLVSNSDSRVILIPVDSVAGTALNPISFESLKKRGTQNLSLFKASLTKNNYADLDGRCSLNLSGIDKGFMSIRNSARSSGELKAETGDFVISKEGDFVGVIVSVRGSDFGQVQEAICYVFPEKINPADFYPLRITKNAADEFYSDFITDIKSIQNRHQTISEK